MSDIVPRTLKCYLIDASDVVDQTSTEEYHPHRDLGVLVNIFRSSNQYAHQVNEKHFFSQTAQAHRNTG